MKIGKNVILLGFIIIIFLFTRLYKITQIPGSVYWDEASIGYNAYSIATDLKDEWGDFLPLHFRAFGEFKLPVYIYSVVPFVKLIGLSALTVRLPAAFYSLGTVVIVYLLVKKITGKEVNALMSAFILTLSPWFFIFSRTGYEVTAGIFFFLIATYLALFSLKNKYFFLLSIFSFLLSFYSYNSFRIIIPVWITILFGYSYIKTKNKINLIPVLTISIIIFLVSMIPVYRLYKYDAGGARLASVREERKMKIINNYFSHYSYKFLFKSGDINPRSQFPGRGQLFLIDIPLIINGIYLILKSKKYIFFIPLILLLLGPIPAAITKESPHALRAILMASAFAMIAGMGIGKNKIIISTVVIIYFISFGFYFAGFITNFNTLTAVNWQYPYKEIFLAKKDGVVTDKYAQPYIFALFYNKVDPQEFRSTVKLNSVDKWGFSKVASFGGYEFK